MPDVWRSVEFFLSNTLSREEVGTELHNGVLRFAADGGEFVRQIRIIGVVERATNRFVGVYFEQAGIDYFVVPRYARWWGRLTISHALPITSTAPSRPPMPGWRNTACSRARFRTRCGRMAIERSEGLTVTLHCKRRAGQLILNRRLE